jgi:high-affinity nickel permease
LEWILTLLAGLLLVVFGVLDLFNLTNLVQFFRGKKTAVEYLSEPAKQPDNHSERH